MRTKSFFFLICLTSALALGGTARLCLAATLIVAPTGDGVFTLRGTALDQTGGMDITITYDAAALGNPRVVPGDLVAGALTAVNPNTPGTVRIGIVRTSPIKGNGVIATLLFDRKGEGTGTIRTLTANLTALDGRTLPVFLRVETPETNLGLSDQLTLAERKEDKTVTAPESSVTPVAPPQRTASGVVTLLPDTKGEDVAETTKEEVAIEEPPTLPAEAPEGDKPVPPQPEILKLVSVLDRFRDYGGERNPEAFINLFEQSGVGGFTQTPSPLLTDGKSVLEVVFVAGPADTHVADMAAAGARLLSRKQDMDDPQTWVVQLQPDMGVSSASLSIPLETFTIVFPLVVAPKLNIDLDRSGSVTPADFSFFLKKQANIDLNKDGKRDYRDDYLFTANYLVALAEKKKIDSKPASAKRSETSPKTEAPRRLPPKR